ncbi:methyltransferase domain-containing protein [Kitasatospora sp. NPDC056138]|uniref:methyltransferase domain-containing protein n=1 Tax=Kitasatospora sp. NPDC056138 TaxID=3345724 RepID=UPI0035E29E04
MTAAEAGLDLAAYRARLAGAMEQRGAWPERSAWIREAVEALPRDLFAPDRLWRWDGHAYVPVDRHGDGPAWARELYGSPDDAAVTQVTGGLATSSLSCQAVVVDMLDSLLLDPGQRVLELGTGAGWNCALAAHRAAGDGLVTSVEVDPRLAAAARVRLEKAGSAARVRVGDGAAGWLAGAPYDRVIATYAVERVPFAWVEQCVPGGRVVTPWGRLGHVALTVADDRRSATGWMQGLAQFMPTRTGAAPARTYRQIRGRSDPRHRRPVDRDLGPLRTDWDLRFALRVALPELDVTTAVDSDGTSAWLHDGRDSWAALSARTGGGAVAHQGGPRRLADALEAAWRQWEDDGRPDVYEYGMTVTPGGQFVWCRDPETGPRWPASSRRPGVTG